LQALNCNAFATYCLSKDFDTKKQLTERHLHQGGKTSSIAE